MSKILDALGREDTEIRAAIDAIDELKREADEPLPTVGEPVVRVIPFFG